MFSVGWGFPLLFAYEIWLSAVRFEILDSSSAHFLTYDINFTWTGVSPPTHRLGVSPFPPRLPILKWEFFLLLFSLRFSNQFPSFQPIAFLFFRFPYLRPLSPTVSFGLIKCFFGSPFLQVNLNSNLTLIFIFVFRNGSVAGRGIGHVRLSVFQLMKILDCIQHIVNSTIEYSAGSMGLMSSCYWFISWMSWLPGKGRRRKISLSLLSVVLRINEPLQCFHPFTDVWCLVKHPPISEEYWQKKRFNKQNGLKFDNFLRKKKWKTWKVIFL